MSAAARPLGALLAGGASRRYGSPKWRAEVGGTTMAARSLAALAPHVAATLVVGSDPGLAGLGHPVRPDVRPGRGPVAGLETALLWSRERGATHVLAVACDLPLLEPPTVGAVAAAVDGDAEAVVPRTTRGPEPLCGAYSVEALPAVQRLLDGGDASLRALLDVLRVRWLDAADIPGGDAAFLNVNAPSDGARARHRLGRRG